MANICDNKFYITGDIPSNLAKVANKLKKAFDESLISGEIWIEDSEFIEGSFESKWNFPNQLFDNFFIEFHDESLYMRCLSEEYGCGLVSMNIYEDGKWKEPQYFNI